MRSRPQLELEVWPEHPRAGERLNYRLTLHSRTDTPVDAVRVRFTGTEHGNSDDSPAFHHHLDLEEGFGGRPLAAGERETLEGSFDLPDDLLPSFRAGNANLTYRIEARVDIPWWPDRVVSWAVPVLGGARSPRRSPGLFSNRPEGPRGTELTLEIALEDTDLLPGSIVAGAVAVENVASHPVARLEARLLATYQAKEGGSRNFPLGADLPVFLCDGPPQADVSYPLRLQLPGNAQPTVHAHFGNIVWRVEVRARVGLGRDVVVAPELTVNEPGGAVTAVGKPPRPAPPVGAERRALVWKEVASRCGLSADSEAETMSGAFGPLGLNLQLELRNGTLWSVATLDWPNTRLDLEVTERSWLGSLQADANTEDGEFDRRFTATARDLSQLRALLSFPVRAALLKLERVTLDDEGAVLASAGGNYEIGVLEDFVRNAVEVATGLAQTLQRIPPPEGLEGCRAAWAAFAPAHAGTFAPGDCSIRGASYRGFPVELVTRFDQDHFPSATVARVLLAKGTCVAPLPAEAQRVLTSIAAECEGVRVTADAVEATLPSPLANPERAELLWRTLQRLAQALVPAAKG